MPKVGNEARLIIKLATEKMDRTVQDHFSHIDINDQQAIRLYQEYKAAHIAWKETLAVVMLELEG